MSAANHHIHPCARGLATTLACAASAILLLSGNALAHDGSYPKTLRINLEPNPGSAAELSRYDHVAFHYRAPLSTRRAVRAANPTSIQFGWISCMSVAYSDTYGLYKAIRDSANAYNWWVYHADGSHVRSWCKDGVDIDWVLDLSDNCPKSPRGERFREWYARTIVDSLVTDRQFTGLFLDECHTTIYWLRDYTCNPNKLLLDLNRDGIGDADSTVTRVWSKGIYDFLRRIRERVGPDFPILCNGAVNLVYDTGGYQLADWVNGVMLECFLHMAPLRSDWRRNMYNINRGYFAMQSRVQPLEGEPWCIIADSGYCRGLTGAELERQFRLTLGSCLLGDAFYTRPPWEDNEWQDEYELCLGQPLAPADSVASGNVRIWVREFSSGYVAVNPNAMSVAVPGRGVWVPPQDAVIALNPPARVPSLTSAGATTTAVQVRFTVPGDPYGCGVPSTYRLRARNPQGSDREWTGSITASPGSTQTLTASSLAAGTAYRFTLMTELQGAAASLPSDTLRVSTLTPADTQPPATITNLAVSDSAQTSLTLRWSAPSDPPTAGAASLYELRRWTDGGSWNSGIAVSGLPSPAAPGTQQSVVVPGLTASTRYHFQIRSRDAAGNNASLSNEAVGRTLTPPDTQPPATITNLSVADSAQTSLTLRWSAPSDPPNAAAASLYDLRRWTDGGSWDSGTAVSGLPSPVAPGTQQSIVVPGLTASTRYHFQIRSRDAAGNNASLSNEAVGRTLAPPDTLGACIADLHVADSTQTSVTVAWTAPADLPDGGAIASYEARLWIAGGAWDAGAEVPSMPAPSAPGSSQSVTVDGLVPDTCYEIAVRTRDLAGNACMSPPLGACTARPPVDAEGPETVSDLTALATSPTSLVLRWTSPADRPSGQTAAYEVRMLTEGGGWEDGASLPDVPAPASPGLAESLRVEALQPRTACRFALRARDGAGNWSAISNTAQTTTPAPPDEDPPHAITDLLALTGGSDRILLTWTAPADAPDDGSVTGYDVRWWTGGGSWDAADGSAAPAPLAPGSVESLMVEDLGAAATHSFAVASHDGLGHVSALSNIASATTEDAPDEEAPATIDDLSVESVTDTSASLAWTAPADPPLSERVHDYEIHLTRTGETAARVIRLSAGPEDAPLDPGERESVLVAGLDPSAEFVATVQSLDERGNLSLPSNAVSFRTRDAADTQPPAAVTDLIAVALGENAIRLTWTAPSDPPRGEAAAAYEARWWEDGESWDSGSPVQAAPLPSPPGHIEEIVLDGLAPGATYVFALRAVDVARNASSLSNEATAETEQATDTQPPSAPMTVTAMLVDTRVDLSWDPAPEPDVVGYHVYRRGYDDTSAHRLTIAPVNATSHTDAETPVAPAFYSVTSVDGAGNESAASGEARVDPPSPPDSPAPAAAPYPNPFRDATTFFVPLATGDETPAVRIYTIGGRFVRELYAEHRETAGVTIRWDGRLANGTRAASGVYLVHIGGAHAAWRRVDLLR